MQKPPYGITSPATLIRVIDGDTIVVKMRGIEITLRLLNVWAPETRGKEAEAGLAAKSWLAEQLPAATKIDIHVPTGEGDRFADLLTFGRVLGYVWRRGEGVSLNEQIVQAGLARREKPQS